MNDHFKAFIARNKALDALEAAKQRMNTREIHEALERLNAATHALLVLEVKS